MWGGRMALIERECHCSFGGLQKRFTHYSDVLRCEMNVSVYLPPQYDKGILLPVLYWLSGLTCNDQNFSIKSGVQQYAAKLGIILVMMDTSPRGESVPDAPSYDLGQGAGFYVNAIQEPWSRNYQMFTYLASELPTLVHENFKTNGRQSIAGHSMGGHGALMLALRHPGRFASVSAFSPIVNPVEAPWGQQAFSAYLGEDREVWKRYDSCTLMEGYQGNHFPILIDQGMADEFLTKQLQPEKLECIARKRDWPLTLRRQDGYDHSYYFVASFIGEHLRFHYEYLNT